MYAAAALSLSLSASARAATEVDLELVLAVDVSLSMDLEEQRLQRDGYVAAFRDPEILKAIGAGPQARIAVAYVEWAGPAIQSTVVPWTLIDGPMAAEAFAARLERLQISRGRMTSIAAALDYSGRLFDNSLYRGVRRVIDISGDGPNNSGRTVESARDDLVAKGIVINGLPVVLKNGAGTGANFFDIEDLDEYYADCVIGGTGAFMIPVRDKAEFTPAIRRKLLMEISGIMLQPRLIPAQSTSRDKADCLIGEKLWERYMQGRFRE
jgi:hypothetical protein